MTGVAALDEGNERNESKLGSINRSIAWFSSSPRIDKLSSHSLHSTLQSVTKTATINEQEQIQDET